MPRPNSRSCRTASIRSGTAGGLAGELEQQVIAAAQIERLGSRTIAPNGPDTAFACRWLPPVCLESMATIRRSDDYARTRQAIARAELTLPALRSRPRVRLALHGRGGENSPSRPHPAGESLRHHTRCVM
jgi:hypothetical protein